MARTTADLSVAELERLLDSRRTQLETLTRRRAQLQKELEKVEQRIGNLEGRRAQAATRRKAAKRPKNDRPLHEYVREALGRSKKGLAISDLADKILEAGYKTNSTNFKNTLYQCLYNCEDFVHDPESGTYRIK